MIYTHGYAYDIGIHVLYAPLSAIAFPVAFSNHPKKNRLCLGRLRRPPPRFGQSSFVCAVLCVCVCSEADSDDAHCRRQEGADEEWGGWVEHVAYRFRAQYTHGGTVLSAAAAATGHNVPETTAHIVHCVSHIPRRVKGGRVWRLLPSSVPTPRGTYISIFFFGALRYVPRAHTFCVCVSHHTHALRCGKTISVACVFLVYCDFFFLRAFSQGAARAVRWCGGFFFRWGMLPLCPCVGAEGPESIRVCVPVCGCVQTVLKWGAHVTRWMNGSLGGTLGQLEKIGHHATQENRECAIDLCESMLHASSFPLTAQNQNGQRRNLYESVTLNTYIYT